MDYLKGAKRGGFIYTATLLLFLAVALIGRAVLSAAGASDTVYYAVNSLFPFTVLTSAVFIFAKKSVKTVYFRKFPPVGVFSALLLAFGMLFGLGFVNSLISDGVKSIGGAVSEPNIPLGSPWEFILFSVCICVLPAFSEELFFRGVLSESLSETDKVKSVLTVALCFALYHGSVAQFAYQFVYGIGLGFLAVKTKSVAPGIIAHFVNNFAVLATEYFNIPTDFFSPLIIFAGIVLLALFVLSLILPRGFLTRGKGGDGSVKDFFLPFGIIGVIMTLVIVVFSAIPGA